MFSVLPDDVTRPQPIKGEQAVVLDIRVRMCYEESEVPFLNLDCL